MFGVVETKLGKKPVINKLVKTIEEFHTYILNLCKTTKEYQGYIHISTKSIINTDDKPMLYLIYKQKSQSYKLVDKYVVNITHSSYKENKVEVSTLCRWNFIEFSIKDHDLNLDKNLDKNQEEKYNDWNICDDDWKSYDNNDWKSYDDNTTCLNNWGYDRDNDKFIPNNNEDDYNNPTIEYLEKKYGIEDLKKKYGRYN
jgi:hypothetical protein